MDRPLRRPEEILAYRPLQQILGPASKVLWTVNAADSVRKAVQVMADKNIGFLVVLENGAMVGAVSERDCARRVVLGGKSADSTQVADIMVRHVVTVDLAQTFAYCLKLMQQHDIRHLAVTDNDRPIAVVSVRDLMREAVAHHAKVIAELERERLTIFTSTA